MIDMNDLLCGFPHASVPFALLELNGEEVEELVRTNEDQPRRPVRRPVGHGDIVAVAHVLAGPNTTSSAKLIHLSDISSAKGWAAGVVGLDHRLVEEFLSIIDEAFGKGIVEGAGPELLPRRGILSDIRGWIRRGVAVALRNNGVIAEESDEVAVVGVVGKRDVHCPDQGSIQRVHGAVEGAIALCCFAAKEKGGLGDGNDGTHEIGVVFGPQNLTARDILGGHVGVPVEDRWERVDKNVTPIHRRGIAKTNGHLSAGVGVENSLLVGTL